MAEDKGFDKYINNLIKEAAKDGIEYRECEENLDVCGSVPEDFNYSKALENYKVSTREELCKLADDHNFSWEHVRRLDEVVQKWDERKKKPAEAGKGLLSQYAEIVRRLREKGIDPHDFDDLI